MAPKPLLTKRSVLAVAKRYRNKLRAAGVPVHSLYLFGSYARGQQRPWSDVDIAVVSPGFGKDYVKESILINRIADSLNTLIEAHPLHPRDLHDRWSTLAQEVIQKGKRI